MFDIVLLSTLLAPVLVIASFALHWLTTVPANLPSGLPIVGTRKGDWFPFLQAKWRNTRDSKAALNMAYSLYKDRPAILPSFDHGNLILLPVSDIKFVSEQRADILSMHESAQDQLQTDFTTMDPSLTHEPLHLELVSTVLTREIDQLIAPILEEVDYCFQHSWGSNLQYQQVNLLETIQDIVSGVTNRAFVGQPLCRNPDVLQMAKAFAQDIPLTSTILRIFPPILRPVIAPIVTLPNRFHTWKFVQLLSPEIKARLASYDALHCGGIMDDEKLRRDQPNDFLQWSIEQAKNIGNPKNWTASALAQRLLLINFAAIHTTSFAVTHTLLDLAASPPETITSLRHEINQVFRQNKGVWSKSALAQLEKLDSVMRESHRKNSFTLTSVNRQVVAKGGLTFPCGVHVAQGVKVGSAAYCIHQDANMYPEPKAFDAFRFCSAQSSEVEDGSYKPTRKAFSSTSKQFLGWGLGKFACPGRFFASNEIKCILIYVLLNYDIETLAARPRNMWIAGNRIPPTNAKLRIKKRV